MAGNNGIPASPDGPYDYIIVGGGTAGCVLANRLSAEPGNRVLLCEAGEDTPPGRVPADILDSFPGFAYLNPRYLWTELRATTESGERIGADDRRLRMYEQARVLGGGSSINGQLANRGSPADFDEWEQRGAAGWNWSSVLPYFRKLERDADFDGPLHGEAGPMTISRIAQEHWSEHAKAMARALAAAGFEYVPDQNGDFVDGYYPVAINNCNDQRVTTATAYLDAAVRARPNLTILTDTRLTALLFRNNTCTGIRAISNNVEARYDCREAILSAGAIFSPAILQRAGIGAAEDLRHTGISVIADVPGVGKRLTDHPSVSIAGFIAPHARINGRTRRHLLLGLRFSSGYPGAPQGDMAASFASKSAWHAVGSQISAVNLWVNKTYSESGVVKVRSPDWRDLPRVDFNLLSDDRDLERLKSAYRLLASVVMSETLRGVVSDVFPAVFGDKVRQVGRLTTRNRVLTSVLATLLDGPDVIRRQLIRTLILEGPTLSELLDDDARLEAFIRTSAVGVWHACCSCRMGAEDDPMAVVDSRCRVRGVQGLRVIDASVFPSIPSANINLPTIMLAERMSDLILQDDRAQVSGYQAA